MDNPQFGWTVGHLYLCLDMSTRKRKLLALEEKICVLKKQIMIIVCLRNSVAPPLLSSISQGGFTGNFFCFGHITAKAFSYIRTEFGASRSMRVGVRRAKQ